MKVVTNQNYSYAELLTRLEIELPKEIALNTIRELEDINKAMCQHLLDYHQKNMAADKLEDNEVINNWNKTLWHITIQKRIDELKEQYNIQ